MRVYSPPGALVLALGFLFSSSIPGAPSDTFPLSSGTEKADAYYFYSLAQQARYARNFPDAVRYLEEAVHADNSAVLNLELAEFQLALRHFQKAEGWARKALSFEPEDQRVREVLAEILVRQVPKSEGWDSRLDEAERIYQGLVKEKETTDKICLELADLQIRRKDFAGATTTLEKYRIDHPPSSEIDLRLAQIYRRAGRSGDAIVLLKGIVEQDRSHPGALDALGSSLEAIGRYEEAVEIWGAFATQNPFSPYAQFRLGSALLGVGRYQEAQENLLSALRGDPGSVRILLSLGQSYEGMQNVEDAQAAYEKALAREPENRRAQFFLARLYQNQVRDEEALALYQQILNQASARLTPEDRSWYVLASTQTGLIRMLQRDYNSAVASLSRALETAEEPATDLYLLMARVFLAIEQTEEAEGRVREGLLEIPGSSELEATLAEILLRQGKSEESRSRFENLLEEGEESEESYFDILQACLRAEEYREAEKWIERALETYPESRDFRFQSAAVQERLGRHREAERQFRKLLEQYPDDVDSLNYLGYMLAERGVKLEEALEMLLKAVAMDPENVAYLDSLGWIYYQLERYEEAETHLMKAAVRSRNDPTIYDHLGDVLKELGKVDAALAAYETALHHDPEHPKKLQKKIRKISPRAARP